MTDARLQFDRVKRYLQRIEEQGTSASADDDLLAFFQNCWHLKDYIKNDPATPTTVRNCIEQDVKSFSSLMIVADLANRSKHLRLDNKRRDAQLTHKYIHAYDGTIDRSANARHEITLDDGSFVDALDVAHPAIVDWEALLFKYGL